MTESALYTVILVVYFSALMGLGFWFNRRNRSRQEFFLARGDLGPATLGFSYSATQMSGSSYMGAVGTERELGYNFAPAGVSSAAAAWFTYVLLGERLRRLASRVRCTTIVDVFEARYRGRAVSMTATLLMLLAFIPLIAAFYLVTAVMTAIVSNAATAVMLTPVAILAATQAVTVPGIEAPGRPHEVDILPAGRETHETGLRDHARQRPLIRACAFGGG